MKRICIHRLEMAIRMRFSTIFASSAHSGSRDSAVGIATGYGLDDQEVEVRIPVG
jgi:hypothetical protein